MSLSTAFLPLVSVSSLSIAAHFIPFLLPSPPLPRPACSIPFKSETRTSPWIPSASIRMRWSRFTRRMRSSKSSFIRNSLHTRYVPSCTTLSTDAVQFAWLAAWRLSHLLLSPPHHRRVFLSCQTLLASGSFFVYDNYRMCHARTSFTGTQRFLRGIYVDRQEVDAFLNQRVEQANNQWE